MKAVDLSPLQRVGSTAWVEEVEHAGAIAERGS